MKKRLLNPELASLVAQLRHGEMVFIADTGSETSNRSLYPLSQEAKYIDLSIATGLPCFQDIVDVLLDAGDFEAALVTKDIHKVNPYDYHFLMDYFSQEQVRQVNYFPDYYELRDRCKYIIQTGDYAPHAQAILIAGYSTELIPMDWLQYGLKEDNYERER